MRARLHIFVASTLIPTAIACGTSESPSDLFAPDDDAGPLDDAAPPATPEPSVATDAAGEGGAPGVDGSGADGAEKDGAQSDGAHKDGAGFDAGRTDAADAGGSGDANDGSSTGVIIGGPCASGAAGATAYRIGWVNAGGTAEVSDEVEGLPDSSRDRAGAYGYQTGFVPPYVDSYLAQGGLQLDSDDFVDLELSTVGISSIARATLALYGRSYSVTTNGSFNWQTLDGTGSTATDAVSNVAPYAWYAADMTSEIHAGDDKVLVRIKAGPSSGALVVNRIELCLVAQ